MISISTQLVFLLLLFPQPAPVQASAVPTVSIGFSCCHFYNPNIGTPVFMAGEDMWLLAERNLVATLSDANKVIISRSMPPNSSAKFYTFRPEDIPGPWILTIQSQAGDFQLPVYLAHSQTNATLRSLAYGLTATELTVNGTLVLEHPVEGGTLMLVHSDNNTGLETSQVALPSGFLHAHVSWDQRNPNLLQITPYTSGSSTLNQTDVWAEVSSEIPLLKQVGASKVITQTPQVLASTNHEIMTVGSNTNGTLKLVLPRIHEVGPNDNAPIRIGPITLTVNVKVQSVVYSLQSETFLFSNGLASSVASLTEIPPLSQTIPFGLTDDLQRLSKYNLFLVTRENGLSTVWNTTITPPVARLRVTNTLNDAAITDYQITSDQIQAMTKVGSETYAIPSEPLISTSLALSIGGVPLQGSEFSLSSTKLDPLSSVEIRTASSETQLTIEDAFGNPAPSGTMKLTRIGGVENVALVRAWNSSDGVVNLNLPIGEYNIQLTAEGSTATRQFTVTHVRENMTLTLNEITLTESRDQLVIAAAISVLVVIEAAFLIRLWKAVSKSKKKGTQEEATSQHD
jgi:hypothetical protein